jgi:hypothetical protein
MITELEEESFKGLIQYYDLKKVKEIENEQIYVVEFKTQNIIIKIQKYFLELYVSLFRVDDPNNEVSLFNLLEYLKQGSSDIPKPNYFKEEKDVNVSYRKQLDYICATISANFEAIKVFFNSDKFEKEMNAIREFVIKQNPNLFKTW